MLYMQEAKHITGSAASHESYIALDVDPSDVYFQPLGDHIQVVIYFDDEERPTHEYKCGHAEFGDSAPFYW